MNSPPPRLLPALEFLLYAVLTAIMLHATWLTWPDAFIDFSRELYLPWRVSCGNVLYRDLAYYFGPISVYLNAALFSILGRPSIHALFALNFAFWFATLLALRALLRRLARPAVATAAVALFILLFSFSRISSGNCNYLAPYSHELPRGFLLSLLSLLALDSATRRRSTPIALLAGILLGLSLFTKPEVALAATASSAALAAALLFGFSARARFLDASIIRRWDVRHPVHDASYLAGPLDAVAFNAALEWIRANTASGSTLAVFPEGAVLNVLSGHPNPTPYVSFPDTDWPRYDENSVLAAYSNDPPDTIVLVRKSQNAAFGVDYAQFLMALLDPLYAPAYAYAIPGPDGPLPYLLVSTRIPPPP